MTERDYNAVLGIFWIAMFIGFITETAGCSGVKIVGTETYEELLVKPIFANYGDKKEVAFKVHEFTDENPCIGQIGGCEAIFGEFCYIVIPKGDLCQLLHARRHCEGWRHHDNGYC